MTGTLPTSQVTAPPGRYASAYVSAKRIHAPMLVAIRKDWPRVNFTARWPVVANISSEHARPARLWLRDNIDDIARSDHFVAFAEQTDELNGTIFEAGCAAILGKPIFVAGNCPGFGKWQFFENATRFPTLDAALTAVSKTVEFAPRMTVDDIANRVVELIAASEKARG